MQNMWLVASSLAIGMQIQSALSAPRVAAEIKKIVGIPESLEIGFACRVGYPLRDPRYLRVRRDIADFVHRNHYATKSP